MAYNILLIESSETDRKDIGTFLESLGYDLDYANTSKEGLLQFEKLLPALVIVEVLLSGNMNGLQICKTIKQQSDQAKVIVTSKLYRSSSMARDAVDKYQADIYLEKPFQMKDLLEHIQDLIGIAPLPEDSRISTNQFQATNPLPDAQNKARAAARSGPARRKRTPRERPAQPEPEEPSGVSRPPETHTPEPATETEPATAPESVSEPTPQVPTEADAPPASTAQPPPLEMEGEVNREHLAKLLHELFAQKVNGVLILEFPEGSKHLFTVDGMPVFVQSNIRQESLGQILVSGGHLSQDQYQVVLEEAAATKKKIGAICVRKGFLTSKQLHDILTKQTAIKVANCFAWETGRYKLDLTRTYPKNAPIFEASPAKIILLAFSKYYPLEILEERFARDGNTIVFSGKEAVYQGLENELSEAQQAFLNAADGTLSLQELIDKDLLNPTEGIRLAYALLAMGVFKPGSVKRDKELDAYKPDPTLESIPDPEAAEAVTRINEMYMRLENEDHFQLLGVDRGVSAADLTERLEQVKHQFRPDILGKDASQAQLEKLEAINQRFDEAYRHLSDSNGRQAYIQSLNGKIKERDVSAAPEFEEILEQTEKENSTLVSELAYQKGQFAMNQQKYHAAVDYFTKACTLEPNTGDYFIRLGYAKYLKATAPREPLDEAFENIQRGLQLAPGNLFALKALAEIERYRGNLESAAGYLQRVLKADPENNEAELELSEIQNQLAEHTGKE